MAYTGSRRFVLARRTDRVTTFVYVRATRNLGGGMNCPHCRKPAHLLTAKEVNRTVEANPVLKKHHGALLSLVGTIVHDKNGRFGCYGDIGTKFLKG